MGAHVTPDLAIPARPWILTEERKLILAASLGTIFEWYDFYLYGALAITISKQFFGALEETAAFLFALLAFAAGFIVRPLGAIFFGRLGDLLGRKHTFLATMLLMGAATPLVGVLPGYSRIGIVAPIVLISLRLLQGLAVGGEYGGAAVYIAEQAPPEKRGYYTGWIQTTATLGLLLSVLVVLCCRKATGDAFETWGCRIPRQFHYCVAFCSRDEFDGSMEMSPPLLACPRPRGSQASFILLRCLWFLIGSSASGSEHPRQREQQPAQYHAALPFGSYGAHKALPPGQ